MITGIVNSNYEMVIKVPVRNDTGQEIEVEAVLDTGFTGSLTLPPLLTSILGLPWRSKTSATSANGNVMHVDVYVATIIWDGKPKSLLIQAIDNAPLLGMSLLIGYDLRASVKLGGSVELEVIP